MICSGPWLYHSPVSTQWPSLTSLGTYLSHSLTLASQVNRNLTMAGSLSTLLRPSFLASTSGPSGGWLSSTRIKRLSTSHLPRRWLGWNPMVRAYLMGEIRSNGIDRPTIESPRPDILVSQTAPMALIDVCCFARLFPTDESCIPLGVFPI